MGSICSMDLLKVVHLRRLETAHVLHFMTGSQQAIGLL